MNSRTVVAVALAAILMAGSAAAVTVTTDNPQVGTYYVGDTMSLTTSYLFDCQQYTAAAEYTATLVDGNSWLNSTETTISFNPTACRPNSDTNKLEVHITGVTIDIVVEEKALAFLNYTVQPGLIDSNGDVVAAEGGGFIIQQGYDPAFGVPTSLSFNVPQSGRVSTTVPVTLDMNANSALDFTVSEFLVDGKTPPFGAIMTFENNASVPSPYAPGALLNILDTPMKFNIADKDVLEAANRTADPDFIWEVATAKASVVMTANDDLNQTSAAQHIVLTFTNTNPATLPQEEVFDPSNETFEEDPRFIPGFPAVAAIAMVGIIAVLRRRD